MTKNTETESSELENLNKENSNTKGLDPNTKDLDSNTEEPKEPKKKLRLKKIELYGFKSFADRTTINFVEGVTGIVGPNGCGKSNISDAFRWVLGEKSAKSLRGNKMFDVIFAGTEKRKPLNFAEITLTLTNAESVLPTEYDEVSVTRKLHRSGESEYLINRNPVRLKDLNSLFLDSGIGKNSFSIFEQGKIDQVIQYSPKERRHIFEEAAGILRFLQRKQETLKKLEQSENNMNRVRDVHQEVEKQIEVLKKQAEEAKAYKENKSQFEKLEKTVFALKWEKSHEKFQELSKKIEERKIHLEEFKEKLLDLEQQFHQNKHKLEAIEETLKVRLRQLHEAKSKKEIKLKDKENKEERFEEFEKREEKFKADLEEIKKTEEKETCLLEELKQKEKVLQEQLNDLKQKYQTAKTSLNELELKEQNYQKNQQQFQKELLEETKKESQLESLIKQQQVRLESINEKELVLKNQLENFAEKKEDLEASIESKTELIEQMSFEIEKEREEFASCEATLKTLTLKIEELKKEELRKRGLIVGKQARKSILEKMREQMEGFSSGTKCLLKEATQKKSVIYQLISPLYKELVAKKGYEKIAALVLQPYTQTLVVKSVVDLKRVLEFAESKKLKDFSLLCLELCKEKGKESKGEKTKENTLSVLKKDYSLSSLTVFFQDQDLANVFFSNIFLAKEKGKDKEQNANDLLELSQKNKGFSFCGEGSSFIDYNGVYFSSQSEKETIFERESELVSLEKEIKQLVLDLEEVEEQACELEDQLEVSRKKRLEVDKRIRQNDMKIV